MTRFISKNSNLRVILEPGFPASPMTGQLARTGLSVKFQDGIADVKDEEIAKKLVAHSAFNVDFVSADDVGGNDPFAHTREEMEPVHVLSEIKYGHVEKSVSSARKMKVPPQLEALINEKAAEMAKAMIPEILKSLMAAGKPEESKEDSIKEGKTPLEKAREAKKAKKEADTVKETQKLEESVVPPVV